MGYIMLINYDKLIYLLTCGCCFAVFVMEHLGMGYPESSTEPVSHVDLSHSTNKKTEQNHAKPYIIYRIYPKVFNEHVIPSQKISSWLSRHIQAMKISGGQRFNSSTPDNRNMASWKTHHFIEAMFQLTMFDAGHRNWDNLDSWTNQGFVDLGSGRGHAVLVAHALFPFRQCVGHWTAICVQRGQRSFGRMRMMMRMMMIMMMMMMMMMRMIMLMVICIAIIIFMIMMMTMVMPMTDDVLAFPLGLSPTKTWLKDVGEFIGTTILPIKLWKYKSIHLVCSILLVRFCFPVFYTDA